jgi:Galactose-3-O-sulfotransferase
MREDLLAHVHVMKTGGQTTCDILRQSFPGRHCDIQAEWVVTRADIDLARRFYPRLRSISSHMVRPTDELVAEFPRIRFFVFLRDPVKRCVSHYQYRRSKGETSDFEPWLAGCANYQVRFLCRTSGILDPCGGVADGNHAIELLERNVGFVGLQERFDESLVLLRRWVDDPDLDIAYRSRNVASAPDTSRQLFGNPRTMELIESAHHEDRKLYRHARDFIYHRQVEAYGPTLAEDVAALRAALPAPQRRVPARVLASIRRGLIYKPYARHVGLSASAFL